MKLKRFVLSNPHRPEARLVLPFHPVVFLLAGIPVEGKQDALAMDRIQIGERIEVNDRLHAERVADMVIGAENDPAPLGETVDPETGVAANLPMNGMDDGLVRRMTAQIDADNAAIGRRTLH